MGLETLLDTRPNEALQILLSDDSARPSCYQRLFRGKSRLLQI